MLIEITEEVKRTWRRRRNDYSAGGVAYRRSGAHWEIALIATRSGTRWQLPKGTCESGETSEQTALREVAEEVGLITTCECFLQAIDYWYWDTYRKDIPELVHKRVDFYLLRVIGGELNDHSIEVDGTAWFQLTEALAVLTFLGERDVVQAAAAKLAGSSSDAAYLPDQR
jgi:8-oxo-dGTP pyrophosphatase MutT (NUDIX family)